MIKKTLLYRPERANRADYLFLIWFGVATLIVYGPIFFGLIALSQDKAIAFFNAVMVIATVTYSFVAILQYRTSHDCYQPVIEPTFVITREFCCLSLRIVRASAPFVLYSVRTEPFGLFESDSKRERILYRNIPFILDDAKEISHSILLPPLKRNIETEGVIRISIYTSLRKSPYVLYVVPVYEAVEQMKKMV